MFSSSAPGTVASNDVIDSATRTCKQGPNTASGDTTFNAFCTSKLSLTSGASQETKTGVTSLANCLDLCVTKDFGSNTKCEAVVFYDKDSTTDSYMAGNCRLLSSGDDVAGTTDGIYSARRVAK